MFTISLPYIKCKAEGSKGNPKDTYLVPSTELLSEEDGPQLGRP